MLPPLLSRSVRRTAAAGALVASSLAGLLTVAPAPAGAIVPPQCLGDASHAFVCGSYDSFVDRTPTQAEVDYWAPKMPAKRSLFLATLGRSLESRRLVVMVSYWDYADRMAGEDEVDYWQGEILKADGPRRLQAALYNEFEGGLDDFVAWAYHGQMGRQPSAEELTYWGHVLETKTKGKMADLLGGTPESRTTKVRFTYRNELEEEPDVAGRDYWAEKLRTGTSYLDLRIAIKASGYPHSSGGCSSLTPPVRLECDPDKAR